MLAFRARFKAVIEADAYQGREASAHHLLLTTDVTADTIIGVLAGLLAAVVPAAPQPPRNRSRDALGGLVTDTGETFAGYAAADAAPAPANDFERGRQIARNIAGTG